MQTTIETEAEWKKNRNMGSEKDCEFSKINLSSRVPQNKTKLTEKFEKVFWAGWTGIESK